MESGTSAAPWLINRSTPRSIAPPYEFTRKISSGFLEAESWDSDLRGQTARSGSSTDEHINLIIASSCGELD